ncbi:MAG: hypothetical protein LQ344_006348 [Seirophora lacunosa]|nr:MAG: hypothetical protein LQ344_006348 [Seirophora lacunosa]
MDFDSELSFNHSFLSDRPHFHHNSIHPMHLRHLHLPGLTPYTYSLNIQSRLVTQHLLSLSLSTPSSSPAPAPSPPPTLLTFQTPPTYTTGRRDHSRLTRQQITHLLASGTAEYHPALRGGQTTYHGPGQLTAYLILHLKHHGFSARSYVRFLEEAVIGTCARFGVAGRRTADPGVWTEAGGRKVASVGVHLRRFVASHGVGVNVGSAPLEWFERIVMCGLEGKKATSLETEGVRGVTVEEVGGVLAGWMAEGLTGVEGVREVDEGEIINGLGGDGRGTGGGVD